jgi:deoxyribonuclease-4
LLIGAHVSVAGGLHNAFRWVEKYRCQSLQIFTKSQFKWEAKPLTRSEITEWRAAWQTHSSIACVVHDAYLINLSSPDTGHRRRSVTALVDEIRRADALGIRYVNTHPGSHLGIGERQGLENCARSLREALRRTRRCNVTILLETTAGQGNDLGWRFAHLGDLIRALDGDDRLGVCVDTCHVFAAGYDFRNNAGYDAMWREFDRLIGHVRLKALHLNDSKFPLGGRLDRHAAIGEGHIGTAGFQRLMNDPRLEHIPGITELPEEVTLKSLKALRKLRLLA